MNPRPMQLPPHETCDGEVRSELLTRDARVPTPLRDAGQWRDEHPPRVAGHSPYTDDRCYDGRHLFDVIESTRVRYLEQEDGSEDEEIDFRARLTCVRCGKVLAWEGTRTEQYGGRVEPAPLAAGELLAQQVQRHDSFGGRDMSTWHVYQSGEQVGSITWASGPRGRAYFVGRLKEWPDGDKVEGPSPESVLRKISSRRPVATA